MRVKFCGITRLEDAEAAAGLGAWAVGLNRWAKSPRRCSDQAGTEIGAALKRRCEVVGVFVNASLDEIEADAEDLGLTMLQLHGDEGPAFCQEAGRRTGARVIKALRVRSGAEVREAHAFLTDYHLLDAHRDDLPGGTGVSFDWELVAGRRSEVPLILAGGLIPDNVAAAIATVHPFAVDVASGVEAEPGIKDHAVMREFFEAAQAATVDPRAVAG